MSSITTTSTADHGDSTSTPTPTPNPIITTIHPDIIKSHILNKLDGPTLASTSCATPQLLSLCSDEKLWKDICNATFPSTTDPVVVSAISGFSSGHKSFYSDSFPSIRSQFVNRKFDKFNSETDRTSTTTELISAVDVYYQDKLIYSKVIVTETVSSWFLNSPLQIDLLGQKETVATPIIFDSEEGACMQRADEGLRVSWILIDPVKKRAVNVASSKCVEARRHWLTEDIKLRFAMVAAGGGEVMQLSVVVTCGGKEGGELHVRDVSMQVEDVEGRIVNGRDSLVILNEAMDGQRGKSDAKLEMESFERFLRLRVDSRERKMRSERSADLACVVAGILFFFAIWLFIKSW